MNLRKPTNTEDPEKVSHGSPSLEEKEESHSTMREHAIADAALELVSILEARIRFLEFGTRSPYKSGANISFHGFPAAAIDRSRLVKSYKVKALEIFWRNPQYQCPMMIHKINWNAQVNNRHQNEKVLGQLGTNRARRTRSGQRTGQ
ncbi:hypothetical protein MKZ38_002979 [Zalerion maritima]|uniref:Uncharacterized protein n=1 Tax=Zalerion maritima TaxID=339359 RepID=A0AAD5RPD1_9PEZI|nr:hypothetical protein MKZ38_002979 [Zalerion maritima]